MEEKKTVGEGSEEGTESKPEPSDSLTPLALQRATDDDESTFLRFFTEAIGHDGW